MKKFVKHLQNFIIIILMPAVLYFAGVLIGGIIPVNKNTFSEGPIQIYLVQNGSHMDIVVPIKNKIINWENIILPGHFISPIPNARYYSFGWGDKQFYRTTPSWDDLGLKTAFKALFLNTPSAMHIRQLSEIDAEKVIALTIETEQYQKLSEYFLKHLEFQNDGSLSPLDFHYSTYDVFYDSKSSFHAFRTCNSWVNNALKYSGLRSCLWTSLAWPLYWQYS